MESTNTISSSIVNAERNKAAFEELYLKARKHENRIYTDKEVALLPNFYLDHPHEKEWKIRKHSCQQLIDYLTNKKTPLEILEVGCGNGWLSAKLSSVFASHVKGIDINSVEITQAKRVFTKTRNLEFINCSLEDELLNKYKFDIIVFAASIQYFSSLKDILKKSFSYLKPGGEVHIIDSPFYEQNEIEAAGQRSKKYYTSIGFPEMNDHYFHHSLEEIRIFPYKTLYNPNSFFNSLKKNKNPLYWLCITKNA